jgi:hypothetical protein
MGIFLMDLSHRTDIEDCYCDDCITRNGRKIRRRFWSFVIGFALVALVAGVAVAQTPPPRAATVTFTAPAPQQ